VARNPDIHETLGFCGAENGVKNRYGTPIREEVSLGIMSVGHIAIILL
jgi:hypothetical protein